MAGNQSDAGADTKKTGFLGAAALGAVAAATAFATVYLAPSPRAPASGSSDTVSAAPAKPAVDQAYVELPEIIVSIGSEPADRYLKMQVAIATDKKAVEQVETAAPILLDAFTTYLRAVEPKDFEDPAFYGRMRRQLQARAEVVLGAQASGGLLITEFLLR